MLYILVSVLLVALSAAFNAISDRLENSPAFHSSIFHGLNEKFWLKEISWMHAKKIFSYKIDAWHLSESIQVVIMICAFLMLYYIDPPSINSNWWLLVYFFTLGFIYNFVFNLFYNTILKRR